VRRAPAVAVPFIQTKRFLRGRIVDRLRDVPARDVVALEELQRDLAEVVPRDRLAEIPGLVETLVAEGIVAREGGGVRLKS
jgi:hypothetical protein